uniref:Uncharacterized protein n=1 Tax=viral metagenome TaxID=1070528 RepID=A0A6C0AML4_9ZZZZ
MIILGLDLATVNWYLVAYVVSSIVFLVYGTMKVYSTGQIRGVIFAIGTFLVLLYYGLHWFAVPSNKLSSWPPVINTCPDYLTYVPNILTNAGSTTTQSGCVDMLGVTSGSSASSFNKVLPTQIPRLDATQRTKVFSYTSADVKAATSSEALQPICDACQAAGLTWEGVYDGDSCIGIAKIEAQAAAVEKCLVSA